MSQPIDEDLLPGTTPPTVEADGGFQPHNRSGLVAWLASGALHGTALLLAATIVVLVSEPPQDLPPMRTPYLPPPIAKAPVDPPPSDPTPNRDPLEFAPTELAEVQTPFTPLEQLDETSLSDDDADSSLSKGRPEAVSAIECGGPGLLLTMGAGPSGSGMFGDRGPGSRRRAVGRGGGSKASEDAVESALRWFKKHQSPNGMWDAEKYFLNCTDDRKCDPGSLGGHGAEEVNVAMTGYALLCFLGAGYDHKSPNKHRLVVRKGIEWLLSVQKPDGLLGVRNYEHPVAVMALAEAYAMTTDPELRKPAQLGVDVIVQRQNQAEGGGYGLGWDYMKPGRRNDASVTGWNVMALKSAYAAGLTVGNAMEGAKQWLEQAWKANNDGQGGRPDWRKLDPYTSESRFSYAYPTGATEFGEGFGHQDLAPVALVCAVFLGHRAGDPMLETLANFVMNKQTPKAYPTNTYYMYYNTLGIFQLGTDSPRWKTWNSVVRDMLVGAQRKGDNEGCFAGSWDWEGTRFHGNAIGRVLSTAYNTLCLEVYYRYRYAQELKLKTGSSGH